MSGPGDLRSRVVEILAGTANGCLTELGYFPGMPQRLKELEQRSIEWQSENVKLYEDNQRLMRILQAQNDRLKLISVPDTQRLNAIQTMGDQLRRLTEERTKLLKENETFKIENHRLSSEYHKLSDAYRNTLSEVMHLRNYFQSTTRNQPPPPPTQTIAGQPTRTISMMQGQNTQLSLQTQDGQQPVLSPNTLPTGDTQPRGATFNRLPLGKAGKQNSMLNVTCVILIPAPAFNDHVCIRSFLNIKGLISCLRLKTEMLAWIRCFGDPISRRETNLY